MMRYVSARFRSRIFVHSVLFAFPFARTRRPFRAYPGGRDRRARPES
jgi:hypothetical protein